MKIRWFICLCLLCLLLSGCAGQAQRQNETVPDTTAWLSMNTDYPIADTLPDGQGQPAKVIVLIGQSNATGCSLTSYLRQGVAAQEYAGFEKGFDSVRISFCMDDQKYTSHGAFLPVDLSCGAGEGCFGPELGMAEALSAYTMSGYSLHHHWLCAGQRGSIYEAFMAFARTYLDYLTSKNYDAKVGAVCWMQGESDTTDFKASHYFDNQVALAAYLRADLETYAEEGGICFIDAGLATLHEPVEEPDLGHYDALSELELGRMFGRYIIKSYEMRS